MTQQSMANKVIKNTGLGILFRVLLMFLAFFNRTVFINTLSEDYLGINGLYTNILSVLSLADLGVNTVLMFFLYEPLAKKRYEQLSALVASFKKIYYGIALAVFAVGIILVPFLPYIVKNSILTHTDLVKYYILYLLNSVCSYLAVYKSTLLLADQKAYVVNFVNFIVAIVQNILYIVVLYTTHNYTLYLMIMILSTIANNIILTRITNKQYPYLKENTTININNNEIRSKIVDSIKNVFLYRVGATVINSTDNILISMIVSTAVVGYYSNYSMITLNLMMLLNFFSQAVKTSMGNYNVNANRLDKERLFRTIQLIYCFISAFAASCLICMMNNFMSWWIQDPKYILKQSFVVIITFKLYIDIVTSPNWMFREASGLFKEARNIMLWAATFNIIFSIVLGKQWGLSGIILATSIAKIITLFWYEPKTFYNKIFKKPIITYWRYQVFLFFVSAIVILLSYSISCIIDADGISTCIIKIIICGIITSVIFLPVLYLTNEGKYLLQIAKRVIHNR